MRSKKIADPEAYIGLAKKAGKLVSGTQTCLAHIKKNIILLIIAEDTSENTKKRLKNKAENSGVRYVVYGKAYKLSHTIGREGRNAIGITDANFALIIEKSIAAVCEKGGVDEGKGS